MAMQKQDDQHEHTFSSYVRIRDVLLKTYLGRWTIGRSGERGSGISVLPAWYDDNDDDIYNSTHATLHYTGLLKIHLYMVIKAFYHKLNPHNSLEKHMYLYISVYAYVFLCTQKNAHRGHTHTLIHRNIYIYKCVCVCVNVFVGVSMCVCVQVNIK